MRASARLKAVILLHTKRLKIQDSGPVSGRRSVFSLPYNSPCFFKPPTFSLILFTYSPRMFQVRKIPFPFLTTTSGSKRGGTTLWTSGRLGVGLTTSKSSTGYLQTNKRDFAYSHPNYSPGSQRPGRWALYSMLLALHGSLIKSRKALVHTTT